MIRNRSWRRDIEKRIFVRRLKSFSYRQGYYFYRYTSINGSSFQNPNWSDLIGLNNFWMFKNYTTKKSDSRYKSKYSPNKNKYRDRGKGRQGTTLTREGDKREFYKILKSHGIKSSNTRFGY